MSLFEDAIKRFRDITLRRDNAVARDLTQVYGAILLRISKTIDDLAWHLSALKDSGQDIRIRGRILRYAGQRVLLEQIRAEMEHFAVCADLRVADAERVAIYDAGLHARELIATSAGIEAHQTRGAIQHLNAGATGHLIGRRSDGAPLRSLLQTIPPAAVQAAKETLAAALALGKHPFVVARELSDGLNIPLARAKTIARTEILSTYRAVLLETYRANSDVVKEWEWRANLSSRTCAMCLAMDGQRFPLDTPFGSHVNCRCYPVPVPTGWGEADRETGIDWFHRQPGGTQVDVLGPGKLKEYRAGKLTLPDLVGYREDPEWGPERYEKSLKQLRQGKLLP